MQSDENMMRHIIDNLHERYKTALNACIEWILQNYDIIGIIASGSIIRGNPDPASDLDMYVIYPHSKRQRVQKFFNEIPCEIFINPPHRIRSNFKSEYRDRRQVTAHMLGTGLVILDNDTIVNQLRTEAQGYLNSTPLQDDKRLNELRYSAACHLEDYLDVKDREPSFALLKLARAIELMIEYAFWQRNRFLPRPKDMIKEILILDKSIGDTAIKCLTTNDMESRTKHALDLADRTIGVHGFFEWESEIEDV